MNRYVVQLAIAIFTFILVCNWFELIPTGEDPHVTGEFVRRREATHRGLVEAGHGAWFGAFLGDRLVSSMGLVRAGEGLARFQDVKTHPDARGRGIAGQERELH